MTEPARRSRLITAFLIILPLWLAGSGGTALWYYFHREKKELHAEQERFTQAVSIPLLEDDLRKIVEIIGERNRTSDVAKANLSRTASMIEGILGPSNTGYTVRRPKGPDAWSLLQVTITGQQSSEAPIWVIASYDSRPGSKGAEANASGLVATIAAAQALARDKPKGDIHFIFLPHFNDTEAPVLPTVAKCYELIRAQGRAKAVICVESMGAGEDLWLSSRDSSAIPLSSCSGLGTVYGTEVICMEEDTDLSSLLFEMNTPAVRVATRGAMRKKEADDRVPFAPTVAASTGRLIELIRRCAAKS
jgi:Peptidase family M28